jgi:hypothetical protein
MTASHPTAYKWRHPNLGRLAVPRDCARIAETHRAGIPWAADNSAFAGFDEAAFVRMLDRIQGVPGCLFVTAPDVVGDHKATAALWTKWSHELNARDLPAAFVVQDGCTTGAVPWESCAAVFVGGTTEYKLGTDAAEIVRESRRRGRWAHMGRVNTQRRIRYAASIGCDSVDGTRWSLWRDTSLPRALDQLAGGDQMRVIA